MTNLGPVEYASFFVGATLAFVVPFKTARLFAGVTLFKLSLRVMPEEARRAIVIALHKGINNG